jgi:hypothetical protein
MGPARSASEDATNELLLQADRIARSPVLSGSDILRNLLTFLVKAAVERPGESVRETEIASVVLGRRDFDARIDSGVRVHTARLRAKLAEYYLGEGAGDPLLIEIPRRSYQLVCKPRGEAPREEGTAPPPEGERRRWKAALLPAALLAAAGLLVVAGWLVSRPGRPAAALRTFWSAFLDSPQAPMVVFATPRFVGSVAEGLRPAPSEIPPGTPIVSEYTGVGEVVAITRLTSLFSGFGREIHLKRSELVTWDDARQRNLVLVGGPETNAVLAVLPQPARFVFTFAAIEEGSPRWAAIEDLKAPAGSPRYYSHSRRPFRFDHAIIVFTTSGVSRRPILILAGTTTMGTQAAAEYVTDPENVARLISMLNARTGALPRFEALLKTTIRDGTPVSTEALAVHKL